MNLIGGEGLSEQIRTYHFPQDQITDHRCKHTEYGILKLLDGAGDGTGTSTVGVDINDVG